MVLNIFLAIFIFFPYSTFFFKEVYQKSEFSEFFKFSPNFLQKKIKSAKIFAAKEIP